MLRTVEAEIDVDGKIELLEPVRVTRKTRAIVTLLEETNGEKQEEKGNSKKILELLRSPEFANRKSYSAEEIEVQIDEARNSWERAGFISMPASLSMSLKNIPSIQTALKT